MNRRGAVLIGLSMLAMALWVLPGAGPALVVFHPSEPPDAILSLASHEWERLPSAALLAQQFPASAVLLTLPAEITESNCHRCLERPGWLVGLGVSETRIQVLPNRGESTHDEAVAARRYAERHRIRRLAVVTSPYHTRRALATFRDVFEGLPVVLGIYPACDDSPARPVRWWAAEYDRGYVAYEWTASLYYRLKFGVPLEDAAETRLPVDERCSWGKAGSAWRRPPPADSMRGPLSRAGAAIVLRAGPCPSGGSQT